MKKSLYVLACIVVIILAIYISNKKSEGVVQPGIISDKQIQKANPNDEIIKNARIEKWSVGNRFDGKQEGESEAIVDEYGGIDGEGVFVNNSQTTVSFVKLKIIYKDKSDAIVNTDETYIIGGEEFSPGERKHFTWHSSNCMNCEKASIKLKFQFE